MIRSLVFLCIIPHAVWGDSPKTSVERACVEIDKIPEVDRPFVRFQSLYAISPKDRLEFVRTYAFVVNSLSRKARLRKPSDLLVAPDLIRLDLRDFKWDTKVYDRLAEIDPYYHVAARLVEDDLITEAWPGGVWPSDGRYYPKGAFQYQRKAVGKGKVVAGVAPWLPADKMTYLVERTQSQCPLLRADWFLVQVSLQEGRKSGYYDFLGLKSRDDFFNLIGFKERDAKERERETATIVLKSGVSEFPRQIFRFGANDGGYWQTRDVFNRTTADRNALNALDDKYKHQAERHYGMLSNGLFAYHLSSDKGEQQNFAPPEVGSDTTAGNNGMRIHIFKSCVSCHKEGLRPIKDVGRTIWQGNNKLIVTGLVADPKELKEKFDRLEQLYLLPYQKLYDRDNAQYTQALAELNGDDWTPSKNSSTYARIYREWAEADVTPEQAAIEVGDGLTDKLLIEALKKWGTPVKDKGMGQVLPPVLQMFTREDNLGKSTPMPILREHFEEVYPIVQYAVRGIVPK